MKGTKCNKNTYIPSPFNLSNTSIEADYRQSEISNEFDKWVTVSENLLETKNKPFHNS
jgi:hypothetical protein